MKSTNLDSSSVDPDENYIFLTNQFLKVVNQYAPLKVKILRGNHASFVDKQLRKEIYKRSKLRNKYCINPSEQNAALYKKQRNKCASLRRRCIKDYFTKITKNGIVTNKNFRKTMKSFLINKGKLGNPEFMLQDKGNIVSDESVLVKTFNEHYINIVEKLCGKKPTNISLEYGDMSNTEAIHLICKNFENHQSIKEIRRNLIDSAPPTQRKTKGKLKHLFPQNM